MRLISHEKELLFHIKAWVLSFGGPGADMHLGWNEHLQTAVEMTMDLPPATILYSNIRSGIMPSVSLRCLPITGRQSSSQPCTGCKLITAGVRKKVFFQCVETSKLWNPREGAVIQCAFFSLAAGFVHPSAPNLTNWLCLDAQINMI